MTALGVLARKTLARVVGGVTVIGLTGSAGKTSTKDLLAQVLETRGQTVSPVGSFNTEIGLPVTALRVTPQTDFLVLEMGARGKGHISYLASLVPPKVGLVLNIGAAHMGEFGGREQTAQAKGELVEALPAAADGGLAVLNADDSLVSAMVTRTTARILMFGLSRDADVRAEDVAMVDGRAAFTLLIDGQREPVKLNLIGSHHVINALGAAAVAYGIGMGVPEIAAALSLAQRRSPGRMEVIERADGVTIINDAYNANPDSVLAAFDAVEAFSGGRRKLVVLGEMAELGETSLHEHQRVGSEAARRNIDVIVGFGDTHARAILEGAGRGHLVSSIPEALELLGHELRPQDVVLVKASKSIGLQALARELASR